jgi:hypothetical protein
MGTDADQKLDPAIAVELRLQLALVDDLWRRTEAAARGPIRSHSLATADDALPNARFVPLYATQALLTALDHLLAWRELIERGHVPIEAHMTLLRGALEGAVRCRWHVEARVHPGTRVGRGIAARRDDQHERRLFEASRESRARSSELAGSKTAVERLAELDDPDAVVARTTAGIRSVGYADTTSLMTKYRLERWYRLASAAAHGKEWALMATQLEPSIDVAMRPGIGAGMVSARDDVVLAFTSTTVRAVAQAVADLEHYTSGSPGRS